MGAWLKFVAFLVIVFFGVGEFLGGWYLGVAPQTPMFVYKKDRVTTVTRRMLNQREFPFEVSGNVQNGTVTVEVTLEVPASFQNPNAPTRPEHRVFREEFHQGERIDISRVLERGSGFYRVYLIFDNATGLFSVDVPTSSEL